MGDETGGPRSGRRAILLIGAVIMALAAGLESFLGNPLSGGGGGARDSAARAQSAEGDFAYYVLALSWSPSFCEDRPGADQCEAGRRFILHGLWPQNERGYPKDCDSSFRHPSDRLLERYADLTESAGLLGHQWRKHGSCTGLSPEAYLEASARAVQAVTVPEPLQLVSRDLDVDPRVIEAAFVDANPGFEQDGVTIKCRDNRLSEVRICLTKDLEPRTCGRDVIRDCGARMIDLPAPD